jgi:RecA/RadA recombinase
MSRKAATRSTKPPSSFSANRTTHKAMSKVAERFGRFRPAVEVIRRVDSVPTRFVQYDHVLGVGGHPISRITLLHGPSNEGKSEFALGLGESFLHRDHFFGFVDAERTTPLPWVQGLMKGLERHPGFVAMAANTYEKVRVDVRRFCEEIGQAREKREVPEDTTGLLVVDSIRKLYPEKLFDELMKEITKKDDKPSRPGMKGKQAEKKPQLGSRAEQIKAAMNARWMDELVPLLADTRCTMVIIAREYANSEATGKFDREWVVGGGKALFYDSSIDVRVSRQWVYDGTEKERRVVGERRVLDIHKTKLSGKSVKVPRSYYHTSNGLLVPEGFDVARDLLELAENAGIVQSTSNGWYTWNKLRLGNGASNVVKRLHADHELRQKFEDDVRAFVLSTVKTDSAASSDP